MPTTRLQSLSTQVRGSQRAGAPWNHARFVHSNGRIKKYGCSYRGMDPVDADVICKGVVRKKYEEAGQKIAELEIWTENPEGVKTSPGTATVVFN